MHIIISRDTFPNQISRDILTLIFLFFTNHRFSDLDILHGSWPQWADKMIKIPARTAMPKETYMSSKGKKSRVTFSVTINFSNFVP